MNYNLKILILSFSVINSFNSQIVYYDDQTELFGIINEFGNTIMAPKYEYMTQFKNGLAIFGTPDDKNDYHRPGKGKYGVVDELGNVVISKDNYNYVCDLSDIELKNGIIQFNEIKNNELTDYNDQLFLKYYDSKGNLLINMSSFAYAGIQNFINGIAVVYYSGKYNFINIQGNVLSEIWFEDYTIIDGNYYGIILNCEEYSNWYHNEYDNLNKLCNNIYFKEITLQNELKKSINQEIILNKYRSKLEKIKIIKSLSFINQKIIKFYKIDASDCLVYKDELNEYEAFRANIFSFAKIKEEKNTYTYKNLKTNEKFTTLNNFGDSLILNRNIDFILFKNNLFLVNDKLELIKDFSYLTNKLNEDFYLEIDFINNLFLISGSFEMNYIINLKGETIKKMKRTPEGDIEVSCDEAGNH